MQKDILFFTRIKYKFADSALGWAAVLYLGEIHRFNSRLTGWYFIYCTVVETINLSILCLVVRFSFSVQYCTVKNILISNAPGFAVSSSSQIVHKCQKIDVQSQIIDPVEK